MKSLNATKLLITVENIKYKTMPSYCLKCEKKCKKYGLSKYESSFKN